MPHDISVDISDAVKAASVDEEESSNGGDEDQASPSRRGSQAEFRQTSTYLTFLLSSYKFTVALSVKTLDTNQMIIDFSWRNFHAIFARKHKTEIRKLKKELLEIRHTEVAKF